MGSGHNGIVETMTLIQAFPPQDINGQALAEDQVGLANYEHLSVHISVGDIQGTSAVTLLQSTDNAGAGEKPLGFDQVWISGDGDGILVKTAVVSDTFDLLAADDNQQWIIEIDASELDVANNFNFVRVDLTDPSAVTDVSVTYILSGARFAGVTMPNPQ